MIFLSQQHYQFITYCLCHSFLLGERTSYTLCLLYQGVLYSHGAVLQGQTTPVCIPYGVTGPPENLLQPGLLSPWAHRSCHTCAPVWASQGVTPSFEQGFGSSMGSRWASAPPWTSMDCRGISCLTMVYTMGCRGISVLEPEAPPPSLSSVTLVSAEFFYIFSPFFPTAVAHQLFPLLSSVMPEAVP